MIGDKEGNKSAYIEHIGLFFFFVACAGVSIIVWVFNWICWKNQCCCCDFLHNPINKRIAWWTCFIFLLGLLACCISGFVTTNRFGFALEGSYCSFERFYYDSVYGQLKETYPRWEGFNNISKLLSQLDSTLDGLEALDFGTLNTFSENNNSAFEEYKEQFLNSICFKKDSNCQEKIDFTWPFLTKYEKILDAFYILINLRDYFNEGQNLKELTKFFQVIETDFQRLKTDFLNKFYYFARIANGWGRVLTMIYFCLLLIAVTFAGFSMMFYVCLINQGYLAIFMHVLWNIIRFFIFSFFFYGAAYGMCYLALRDAVAYVMFVFGEDNLSLDKEKNSYLIPKDQGKEFLNYCLINKDNNFKNKFKDILTSSLEDLIKNSIELEDLFDNKNDLISSKGFKLENEENLVLLLKKKFDEKIKGKFKYYEQYVVRQDGLFGSFDCSFLKSDLSMMYRTLYDLSVEARILCALSCCIGFFGAIAVYFFLLVLHHYNMDLFFDSGQSIFTGFDRNASRKKMLNKDPGYKKRKIRAEIELSSRNEEYSGIN